MRINDLLLSDSGGYLLLSLATSGASQTSLLFLDGGGSYPVNRYVNDNGFKLKALPIETCTITHMAGNHA